MFNKQLLENILGEGRIKTNFDLSPFLTIRVGVKAPFFFEAVTKNDLINVVRACSTLGLKLIMLGSGSNTVIFKLQPNTLIVKNRFIEPLKIVEKNNAVFLTVASGYLVSRLVTETIELGIEGFEYHLGLPGTVGGAIYMNSKWTKHLTYFGDNLHTARLVGKNGNIKQVERSYFQFAYDSSILQKTKEILLDVTFKLNKNDPDLLSKRAREALEYRHKTQPFGVFTSGCFFRNVQSTSAGALIDKAGLKGLKVGNFYVSDKHANFIINRGGGQPQDLMRLVSLIKEKVKEKFSVELKEEVVVV